MNNATEFDRLAVNAIRVLAIEAVEKAKSGHPGMPLGAAPMAHVLWSRHLRYDPADPAWPDRDRFILSAGHGSMLLYALLHIAGYDLSLDDIEHFRQWGSRTPGHPEHGHTAGVEVTTGPLGQGFANGVGMAIAEAFLGATFNRPGHEIVDHRIYGIVSDGDLMEGISSEAASLAGHLGLGRLIYLYDDNHISIEGSTALAFTEDVAHRFGAYSWHVLRVEDGNDFDLIDQAITRAEEVTDRPSLIMVRTHIGYGSPHKQDSAAAHGSPLGEEEVRLTREALGWPYAERFFVPEEVYALYRDVARGGADARAAWHERLGAHAVAHPEAAEAFARALAGDLPAGWRDRLPTFAAGESVATRVASGKTLNALSEIVPILVGGSADLAPSTNTLLTTCGDEPCGDFQRDSYAGRNLHFGVREHAMGGILNGLALHGGVIPYGATFLVFSDYMRPSIRLAALSGAPVTYVFTHDSVGLGEDGPTHQPVEHLAALRVIPNLRVVRPSDANETVLAWRMALEHREGPTALVLSRQNLPVLDRTVLGAAEGLLRGGYVLAEAGGGAETVKVIMLATGSEVAVALEARELLEADGIGVRVVALPCWEVFAEQDREYREAVLPPGVTARVAVEAAATTGWERWVGDRGVAVGIDRFGASAPGPEALTRLGITASRVAREAERLVAGNPLTRLQTLGQSVWYDNIGRGLLLSGGLQQMIDRDAVVGLTSNPSIFQKAIAQTAEYDEAIVALVAAGSSTDQMLDALIGGDVRMAADLLLPAWEASGTVDGWVSIEVAPSLAGDVEGTVAEAHRLRALVGRPNVLVKVPATRAGVQAVRRLIGEGVSVNVTLIFALERYAEIMEAYLAGLEDLVARRDAGADLPRPRTVRSVASFFVSRVDSKVDARLEQLAQAAQDPAPAGAGASAGATAAELRSLQGKAAVANAKLAYRAFAETFRCTRWEALAGRGALVQRPLWASTSTKNPSYRDVVYIEELVGVDTVNTVPQATLDAFRDHGVVAPTLTAAVDQAAEHLAALEHRGVGMADVTAELEAEGVKAFADAFAALWTALDEKRIRLSS